MKSISVRTAFACVLIMLGPLTATAETEQARQPTGDHILLITIDDLNDWIGCMSDPADPDNSTGMVTGRGHPQASTPNLDRLAQRGILFTNAHCQAPMCRPSRASFLSGLRPSDTGLYSNNPKHDAKGTITPGRDVPWLTRRFEAAGYQTFSAGKVIHGSNKLLSDNPAPPTGQGPYPDKKMNVPASVTPKGVWDYGPYPEQDRFTDWRNAQWTIRHIRSPVTDGQRPRLLALGFYRPHVPLFAPQKYFDAAPAIEDVLLGASRADDYDDLPEIAERLPSRVLFKETTRWVLEDEQRLRGLTQAYLACTSAMDDCLGEVLDALDQSDMADNTWIVVFSDHGWHLGEKNHIAKQTLWERSTHVPMIIVPPARLKNLPRGERCDQPVELIDVYPTLLEATRLETQASDEKLAGMSLLSWMKKPDQPRERPALTTLYSGNHSLCDQNYRFIQYADGSRELYNRIEDPHEFDNLISQVADNAALQAVVERLSGWLPEEQAGEPDLILDD